MQAVNLGVITYGKGGEGGGEEREKLRERNRKENLSLASRSGPKSFCFNSPKVLAVKVLKWY